MKRQRQIIALGGGGFAMEPRNKRLDNYILSQSKSPNPKICFIPTASGDSRDYIQRFYRFFDKQDCVPAHLELFKPIHSDFESFLLEQDIIYVGGGNTRNMLLLWKEWGIDKILQKAYKQGILLAGMSAGAICWFEQGITDPENGELYALDGLGFLPGSSCPHYDGESKRRPAYKKLILNGHAKNGYAIEDGVGLHFVNEKLLRAISSRKKANAFFAHTKDGTFYENKLSIQYIKNAKLTWIKETLT